MPALDEVVLSDAPGLNGTVTEHLHAYAGELCLVLAMIELTGCYDTCVLTPRGEFGWALDMYFDEV